MTVSVSVNQFNHDPLRMHRSTVNVRRNSIVEAALPHPEWQSDTNGEPLSLPADTPQTYQQVIQDQVHKRRSDIQAHRISCDQTTGTSIALAGRLLPKLA